MNRSCRLAAIGGVLLLLVPALSRAEEPLIILPAGAPDLSGDWSGYWISSKNGHHGPLRATFTCVGDNCYRVRFKGRFAKIIPFRYRTTMTITGVGDGVATLVASRRLGPVLGTFAMTAVATPTTFEAEFSSKNDCGRFVLTRCCVG
jgi:hypothetical protein